MEIINRKKKQFLIPLFIGVLTVSFCISCNENRFEDIAKYQRPERLDGKLYTQISKQENMSVFAQLMVDVGYDQIVDKSGTYAAFVPTDDVLRSYLTDKYGTSDPAAIDSTEKSNLVKYHLLQMPWSKTQLQTLSARGWINLDDVSNNKPTAFKRRTLLREPNRTYKVQRFLSGGSPYDIILSDNASSSITRTVFKNSRKYVPLFFDGFMNAKGLGSADYSFYFNRSYESGELYYANAKIVGDELFAENGFVYALDQVVEPLKNAEQLMEEGPYSTFLQLIHNYPVFKFNQQATLAQEGAAEGKEVEDLYNLTYSAFNINIHDELVGSSTNTVEKHEGILAPTNEAMDKIFNQYLSGWGNNWNSVPKNIQRLMIKTHFATEAVYKKDIENGFYNEAGDLVSNEDFEIANDAVKFGSNSTFIGLSDAIVPKYFSSVSAPLMLDPLYSAFFGAYSEVDLLSALKDATTNFSFFIVDNTTLSTDSSMFVTELENGRYRISGFDREEESIVNLLGSNEAKFTRKLFGQIGVQPILGQAKREFIETLDGRHIVVQNDTVSGGAPSEYGLNSGRDTTVVFSEITDFPITNGKVYGCNGWLSFPLTNVYTHVRNTKFLNLLDKAGLASLLNERVTFTDPTERYTIFVPSDAALNAMQVDTLSVEEVKELVSFHIVKGDLIFTDGRLPQDSYRTLNNKFLNLNPQPDNLQILDENFDVLYDDLKLSSEANLLGMYFQNIEEDYFITNVVVHKIDTVITPY